MIGKMLQKVMKSAGFRRTMADLCNVLKAKNSIMNWEEAANG